MEGLIIPVVFAIIISIIAKIIKPQLPAVTRILTITHFISLFVVVVCFFMVLQGYRFAGPYTHISIALIFLCSGILLYGFATTYGRKMYAGFIAWPTFVSLLAYCTGLYILLIPAMIGYMFFSPPHSSVKINNEYRLEEEPGFMKAPLNNFSLRKKTMLIFEKKIQLQYAGYHHPIRDPEIAGFAEHEYVAVRSRDLDSPGTVMRTDTFWFQPNILPVKEIRREGATR